MSDFTPSIQIGLEWVKQVITLGSAGIAVTVAFGKDDFNYAVAAAVGLFVGAVLFGLLSLGRCAWVLEKGTSPLGDGIARMFVVIENLLFVLGLGAAGYAFGAA